MWQDKLDFKKYDVVYFGVNQVHAFMLVLSKKPIVKAAPFEVPQTYKIAIYAAKSTQIIDIQTNGFCVHYAHLLSKNRLLLVSARSCYRGRDDYDLNGRIYGLDGELQQEMLLGDGIENVHVSDDEQIWTSYFDEGVFGNRGWVDPIGSCGLIAWHMDGSIKYRYEPIAGLDYICDCYALNVVSNHTSYCYYYTEFPLVKIKNHEIVDYWHVPISGSHAFAIYRNFALFLGDYQTQTTLFLLSLNNDHTATMRKTISLKDHVQNIDHIERVCARGDGIFILSNDGVTVLKVYDFL